jgi:hypothetical protein
MISVAGSGPPVTSGVTDRYKLNRYSRLRPGMTR